MRQLGVIRTTKSKVNQSKYRLGCCRRLHCNVICAVFVESVKAFWQLGRLSRRVVYLFMKGNEGRKVARECVWDNGLSTTSKKGTALIGWQCTSRIQRQGLASRTACIAEFEALGAYRQLTFWACAVWRGGAVGIASDWAFCP